MVSAIEEEVVDGYLVRRYPGGAVVRALISEEPELTPAPRVLTHKQFRDRLSFGEQLLLDNFSVAEYAEADPKIQALGVMQRAEVRTAIATFRDAQNVDLDDPATIRLVTLLGSLELLDEPSADRVEQILRGAQ